MTVKTRLFSTKRGIFSFTFLFLSVVSFIIGEIFYGFIKGETELYVSIILIAVVCLSAVFLFYMLYKSERKIFLYLLFALPLVVFDAIRLVDIFTAHMDYIMELVIFIASAALFLDFLIFLPFYIRKDSAKSLQKKIDKLQQNQQDSETE